MKNNDNNKEKPKNRRDIKIFLNNKKIQQADTVFTFNQHIDKITRKSIKIVPALSKSAKINWGFIHDVLRIIYNGAILPLLA